MPTAFDFLKREKNSLTREALLRHRFIYDVGLAAARRDYGLQVFVGEVDREGFDVVLDDADRVRKVQLKSVFGSTKNWELQKNHLRPEPCDAEGLGFAPEPTSIGTGGAVVLQIVGANAKNDLDVSYAVTDIAIIAALECKLIRKVSGTKPARKALSRIIEDVAKGDRSQRVVVPRGAFIRVRTPGHLLAALGLHATEVQCGDLVQLVTTAKSAATEAERAGATMLLVKHMTALSPDFGAE